MPGKKRPRRERTHDWQQIQQYTLWPEQQVYELLRPVVLFQEDAAERARVRRVAVAALRIWPASPRVADTTINLGAIGDIAGESTACAKALIIWVGEDPKNTFRLLHGIIPLQKKILPFKSCSHQQELDTISNFV